MTKRNAGRPGKPRREGVCECERVTDPNLAQALHTLNSETIMAKVANPQGRVAKLLAAKKTDAEMLLCALYRREEKPKRALPLLEDLLRRFPRNNLLLFEEAQMYSSIGNKK